MEEETALLMKKIRESTDPVNLGEMFTELTNNIVCRSAFGRMYSKGESGKKFLSLLREFLEELTTISIGDFVPCLSWINRVNGFDSRVDKLAKEVDEFLEGVIRECLETPNELVAANTAIILEPEKFQPDRFFNSSTDFKSLDFEVIPFGAGSRGCPGMAFAMATNEFVLANLVQKFDWKLPDEGKDLDMSERPGGVIRRAVPRLAMGTQYHS